MIDHCGGYTFAAEINNDEKKMSKKIYLITGAAGFLGGTVCRHLIERGEQVRALVLPNDKAKQYIPSEVEIIEGNVCDKESLARFFDVDSALQIIVLHIASIVTVNPAYDERVISVNVDGTRNIIEACRGAKNFQKLIYCGSTGSIPEQPHGTAISEVDSYDPLRERGCYSQSKAMACQAVVDAAREGLNACIVHPSGIMGPEDFAVGETTKTLIEIIGGRMPVGIDGSFNLADVRDLADGVIAAVERGRKGESYILANREVTFREFAQLVQQESGCKPMRGFLPCSVARVMAQVAEWAARLTGKMPMLTTFSVYNLSRNNNFDSTKAERELGYRTRPYKETMRDEIAWLKASSKI